MSSCPAGLRRLSFDVIGPAFSRRPPPVAAHLDIGAAVRKLYRFAVLSVSEKAGRTRSRLLEERPATSQSPGCLQQVAPPAIPEPGSASVALEGSLDSPARPGPRRKSSQTS